MKKEDLDLFEIQKEIDSLPQGGISYKNINGKRYAYYQWRENGKQHSRRAKDQELESLTYKIEKRKELQQLLKEESFEYSAAPRSVEPRHIPKFNCVMRTGNRLKEYIKRVHGWNVRSNFYSLKDYIYSESTDRLFILYGLKNTGKTTLMSQVMAHMSDDMLKRTAYILVQEKQTFKELNEDMEQLEAQGYKYIFIDQITLLEGFQESLGVLADIYVASGMKVVLTGGDSLSFAFAKNSHLSNKAIFCHTTYLSYGEYVETMNIKGIDGYLEHGGIMSNYLDEVYMTFFNEKSAAEYVNLSLGKNIERSIGESNLGGADSGGADLGVDLNGNLSETVSSVLDHMNCIFLRDVLSDNFHGNSLKFSQEQKEGQVNIEKVNKILKELVEIKLLKEQAMYLDDFERDQIEEYLRLLDVSADLETRYMSDYNKRTLRAAITQPGLRYVHVKTLVERLMEDEIFRELDLSERKSVTDAILEEVKRALLKDTVMLDTMAKNPKASVFSLQFVSGKFDMVLADFKKGNCEIFQISRAMEPLDPSEIEIERAENCQETEFRYGKILGKYVIYMGPTKMIDGISYINIEEFLCKKIAANF